MSLGTRTVISVEFTKQRPIPWAACVLGFGNVRGVSMLEVSAGLSRPNPSSRPTCQRGQPEPASGSIGTSMPAYLIANITVRDPERFAAYVAGAPAIVERFGGRYLVRGGHSVVLEGDPAINRTVIIEFPTLQHAKDFYADPQYQQLVRIRQTGADTHMFCIEGYPGQAA